MNMKIVPAFIVGFLSVAIFMTSCLSDDTQEITYSKEASIKSFSLGTLKIQRIGKDKSGNDSAYVDTMSMAKYPFTIDQLKHEISNKDSLPVGTDISKVITNISADTPYILYGKIAKKGEEAKDTLWTNTDSLDFSIAPAEGIVFKVMAYDGSLGTPYKVKVNVHNQVPDSLQWTQDVIGSSFVSGAMTKQKAVYLNQKIFVFGQNSDGETVAEYTKVSEKGQPSAWTKIALPTGVDSYSALASGEMIYFLAEGKLYAMDGDGLYAEIAPAAPVALSKLVASVNTKRGATVFALTAGSDTKEISYAVADGWSEQQETALSANVPYYVFDTIPTSYNDEIKGMVVLAQSSADYGFVAARQSNDDFWSAYDFASRDTSRCPNIENPTLLYYGKKLIAFGGAVSTKDYAKYKDPFSTIYCSTDHGLTWKPTAGSLLTFAVGKNHKTFAQLYAENGNNYSCVADTNHFIWVVWGNGMMSRGRINYYGFAPKQW